MTRRVLLLLGALAPLGAVACGLDDDEREGELGRGAFRYVCVDASDRTCEDGEALEFPDQVATGSRFILEARGLDWREDIDGEIVAASDKFIERLDDASSDIEGYLFETRVAGTVAMLASRVEDGAIGDLTHIVITDLMDVDITCEHDAVTAGDTTTCSADPGVGGALAYRWTTSDATIVEVEAERGTAEVQVRGVAEGTATLHVEVGDLEREIVIFVEPATEPPPEPPPDAATESDAGDDDAG